MSTTQPHALVVGAGVIGLSSAFRLASAGWRVTIVDPSPGMGATHAAAGMIAPAAEVVPGELANYRQQCLALEAWCTFADDIAAVSSTRIELYPNGTLLVGLDASDQREIDQFEQVVNEFGSPITRVFRDGREELFDALTPRVGQGLYLEHDAWLDPDRVVRALLDANQTLGVTLIRESVLSLSATSSSVHAHSATSTWHAEIGILATGATPLPRGIESHVRNVIRPVRGMTIRLQGVDRSSQPVLRGYVHGNLVYVVSRPGGYCVVGASSDEQMNPVVEVGDLQRLLRDVLELVPSLENAHFLEARVGLRPASRTQSPFLEVIDQRWAWLSGYYRHGVTLAPLAAQLALDFAQGLV